MGSGKWDQREESIFNFRPSGKVFLDTGGLKLDFLRYAYVKSWRALQRVMLTWWEGSVWRSVPQLDTSLQQWSPNLSDFAPSWEKYSGQISLIHTYLFTNKMHILPNWNLRVKSWLIGKDPNAGRNWGQEEKGTTEDEMAGWHHGLDGPESEWTPGDGDGQGGLACCDSCAKSWTRLSDWT